MHAEVLSANRSMLGHIRRFADSGKCLYAECGGLMYLSKALITIDGRQYPLAGALPATVSMHQRLRSLSYVEVTLTKDSIWGKRGATFRGHEFHYSELAGSVSTNPRWETAYSLRRKLSTHRSAEGFQNGRILASYVHLHFASQPSAVEYFLEKCRESDANEAAS